MRGFVKSVRLRRTLLTKPLKLGFYHIPAARRNEEMRTN